MRFSHRPRTTTHLLVWMFILALVPAAEAQRPAKARAKAKAPDKTRAGDADKTKAADPDAPRPGEPTKAGAGAGDADRAADPDAAPDAAKPPEVKKAPVPQRTLIVGTKHAPPFAIKHADGTWTGISLDLWRYIAKELKLKFEIRERTLNGLLNDTREGKLDAAVAALTITAGREAVMDFSHPFFTSGLGIAVPMKEKTGWWAFVTRILSAGFIKVLLILLVLLLGVGVIVWLLERKRNPDQFGGSAGEGVGAGLWWSAVTMTTVGYGDKAPVTVGGRLVGLVWMFASIIIISSFTAAITTALTVSRLESGIKGPDDLAKTTVGTVGGSTSAQYLKRQGIASKYYKTTLEALHALATGKVGAVVYDAPILRYLAKNKLPGKVRVLQLTFHRQDYGFALPDKSPLREAINRELLKKITHFTWKDTLRRYLGR